MYFPSHACSVFPATPSYKKLKKSSLYFQHQTNFMNQQEQAQEHDGKMSQKVSYGIPHPPRTHLMPPFVPTASTLWTQQFCSSASWSTHHHTTSTLPF